LQIEVSADGSLKVEGLDDGPRQVPADARLADVAALASDDRRRFVAARWDGRLVDLSLAPGAGGRLELLTLEDPDGLQVLRHSAAHVLAQAVLHLFPKTKFGIGPAIEDGFYYDFDAPRPFTPEDLKAIRKEMKAICKRDLAFERRVVSRDEAVALFRERGDVYKVELIEELPEDAEVSLYSQGDFIDLCTGPHVPSTGFLRVFDLLSVAGAYWRGDEKRPMLQRVYGTVFAAKEELAAYLERREEAKRRDHRRLGRDLDLYSAGEEAGAGLILFHPAGGQVRQLVEDFWRDEHRRRGYDIVFSPHIARLDLWKRSGHWAWYKESMYSPIDVDGVEYLLKPMNCPFHILMYESQTRSYRDLPMRLAELGTVYRYERSGVLHGLLRVRGFTQDDAHIFCRPDQIEDEIGGVIDLARYMIESFGFPDYDMVLSVRDPQNKEKYIGADDVWERAEGALAEVLQKKGVRYSVDVGEAKFYGPAIDIMLTDALGRKWQGPTIQLDFNLAERFDITYMGEDNKPHRPVLIHRTVLGSMERFLGNLIEHYAGAFPLWLAPEQVRVLPITDDQIDYARRVRDRLRGQGWRAEVDGRNEKVGYKIRAAQMAKVPYMLIVGEREAEDGTVAVRSREEGDLGPRPLEEFADAALNELPPHARCRLRDVLPPA